MTTLIIYNSDGKVLLTHMGGDISSTVLTATADVPDGKYVASVDPETKTPVLEDLPKTEDQQKIAALEAQQEATNQAVLGLMDMMMTN